MNVKTHLPALRVFNLDPVKVQTFLEDTATYSVTVALDETIFTPTCLAKPLGSKSFLLEKVLGGELLTGVWFSTTGITGVWFSTTGIAVHFV